MVAGDIYIKEDTEAMHLIRQWLKNSDYHLEVYD